MSSGIPLGITSEDSYIVLQGSQGEGNGHYTNGAVIHHRQVTMTHPRAPFHRPAQKPEEGVTSFSNRPYKSEALLQHVQSNIARPLAYRPRERPSDVTWYCSECFDGPYGNWQVSCQACGHRRCGGCRKEKHRQPSF